MMIQDVHNAVRDVTIQGGHTEDIQAFLINSDDLRDLLKEYDVKSCSNTLNSNFDTGSLKIFGVKIIQSPYTERGTIFKIMKDNQKQYAHHIDEMGETILPKPHEYGMWSNWSASRLPSSNQEIKTSEVQPEVSEEKKSTKKRHSETRKIKLD